MTGNSMHFILKATIHFFLILFAVGVMGQVKQGARFEKELKPLDNSFNIVSMHQDGIALIREKNKLNEGKHVWEITLLDTLLHTSWSTEVSLEFEFRLVGYDYSKNSLYLLFRKGDVDSNDLHMWRLNLGNHTVNQYDIKHQFNLKLSYFNIVGNHAIFGGYVTREPAVLLYEMNDMNDNRVKVVPGFFLTDTEMLDLRVNVNNTFNTLLMERHGREKRKLSVRTFDESGTLLLESAIEIPANRTIVTGITSTLKRDELVILGTYGGLTGKQSVGYFSIVVDPYKPGEVNYYDFGSLTHALDYLSPKRAAKIKEKSMRAAGTKKLPDFKLYAHSIRIEENSKGYFLLSEIYIPSSSYTPYPYWNNYANPYASGYGYYPYGFNSPMNMNRNYTTPYGNNFQNSGTRIMETIVTFFDSKGKLVWDHSLKLGEIKFPALEQAGDFVNGQDHVTLAYKKENKIYAKKRFISDDAVEEDTVNVQMLSNEDILRFESRDEGGLRYWYNNSFYLFGYESVKNKQSAEDNVRYVFYINKVEAD